MADQVDASTSSNDYNAKLRRIEQLVAELKNIDQTSDHAELGQSHPSIQNGPSQPLPGHETHGQDDGANTEVTQRTQDEQAGQTEMEDNHSIRCFGQLKTLDSGHDRLVDIDSRIWRGRLDQPNQSFDGHPSWADVLAGYHERLTGRDLDTETVHSEMDRYLAVQLYQKRDDREVFCAGNDHNPSCNKRSTRISMRKIRGMPLKKGIYRGIWVCTLMLRGQSVDTLLEFVFARKGPTRIYRFWKSGGGYTRDCGLLIGHAFEPQAWSTTHRTRDHDTIRVKQAVDGSPEDLTRHSAPKPVADDPDDLAAPRQTNATPQVCVRASASGHAHARASGSFPGPLDSESFSGKRKEMDFGKNMGRSKVRKSEPFPDDRISTFPQPVHGSPGGALVSLQSQGSKVMSQEPSTARPPLRFQPRSDKDYKDHIIHLFRLYNKLGKKTVANITDWHNRVLTLFSSEDLESRATAVYFRPTWTVRRDFNGLPHYNMEAVLTHISGSEQLNEAMCEQCKRSNGPFTTCVVRVGMHKGACSNCAYNLGSVKCSFRTSTDTPKSASRRHEPTPGADEYKPVPTPRTHRGSRIRQVYDAESSAEPGEDVAPASTTKISAVESRRTGSPQPTGRSNIAMAPIYDQLRTFASGDVAEEIAVRHGATSDHNPDSNTASFLDYVTLVVNIEGDPTVIEMGMGGCSTLDALLRKLKTARSLRRSITDQHAISCIEFKVVGDQSIPVAVVEPGDATLYLRLLKNTRLSFEQSGREEMAVNATVELTARS
ncbi:hypothetical protein LTS10_007238 [Elasticomyces elasticus]|nr:hypothetical protein LTS10_007238 [Elasticomyces elasticus]